MKCLGEGSVSTFYGAFRPIQVVFVFLLVRKLLENRKFPLVFEKVVVSIGKCTFGIYLIEQALRESLQLNDPYLMVSSARDNMLIFLF